jgi:hypothetical protein
LTSIFHADIALIFHSWKTRFLVKAENFLSSIIETANGSLQHQNDKLQHQEGKSQDQGGKSRDLSQVNRFQDHNKGDKTMPDSDTGGKLYQGTEAYIITAKATVHRIRHAIDRIMAYILKGILRSRSTPLVIRPENTPGPNYYYVMVTIWYIVKHYPDLEAKWHWKNWYGGEKDRGILGDSLDFRRHNPSPWSNHAVTKVKYSMLKWLHYESVLSLQGSAIPPVWNAEEDKVKRLRYAARTELVKRISLAQPYRADDEIADRLAFLAEELWPDLDNAKKVADRITRRIQDREFTQTLNLCSTSAKEGSDDGPWEVHALCHHSRLVVAHRKMCATDGGSGDEVERFRRKFCQFLTSEASLMPCWERNSLSARRGFLRSESTAVLASTLVNIFQKDLEYIRYRDDSRSASRSPSTSDAGEETHENGSLTANTQSQVLDGKASGQSQGDPSVYHICPMRHLTPSGEPGSAETLLTRQLETLEQLTSTRGLERQIDYLKFRPPQIYHPEEFFKSFEDTPDLYTASAIDRQTVPAVISKELSTIRRSPPEKESPGQIPRNKESPNVSPAEKALQELIIGPKDVWKADIDDKLAVIDLKTRNSLKPSKPDVIRGRNVMKVISDSVSYDTSNHHYQCHRLTTPFLLVD